MNGRPAYRELPAPPALAEALACSWTSTVPSGRHEPLRVLPDGCIDLIWQEGVGTHVAGPDTGPVLVDLAAGTVLVGVRFRPGAGGPALDVPLHQLRDCRVDLADLRAPLARRLHGRLSPAEAGRRLVDAAVGLVEVGPPDRLARAVAEELHAPGADVDGVARRVGLSPRQLRRRCHDAIGYGPKTLHRVLRVRTWLDRLAASPDVDLARLAAEAGYADQAHLTRECVQLTGLTPSAQARRLAGEAVPR